ncbi:MAG TPA: ATP-binding protein [Longimicrobiales bacterium]
MPLRRAGLAFLFIILALFAIALLPPWVARQTAGLRQEIQEVILPAQALATEIQSALAREVAGSRGFLLTGDRQFLDIVREAQAVEIRSVRALDPLARRLGPGVGAQVDTMERRIERWHALSDSLVAGLIAGERYVAALPEQEARYEAALTSAVRLEWMIEGLLVDRQAAIVAANRRGWIIGGLLVALALVAALDAGWLYRQQRRLTEAVEESRAAALRQARSEAALREAVSAVVAAATTAEVVRAIGARALVATDADGAFVARLDAARGELEVAAAAGSPAPPLEMRIAYRGSLSERVITRGRPEIVASPEAYPPLAELCAECSFLAVPLGGRDRPFGALFVVRRPSRTPFTSDEVERALIFGELATLAFRRLQLLETSEHRRLELQRLLESRDRLTRGLSHDVKNPLGAADGFLQLLEMGVRGPLNSAQREGVGRAREAIREAVRLLDEVLEIARAEAGQLGLTLEPAEIGHIAHSAAEEYRAQAEAKHLDLRVAIPEGLTTIETDAARARRIIGNLLSNAVKYTGDGGRIEIRVTERENGGAPRPGRWIAVAVTDTGPGIPKEKQRWIFEEFTRIGGAGAEPGAGLGLAVSQRLAHALGGAITVESEVGRGSTFTLWLPVEPPTGAAVAEAA